MKVKVHQAKGVAVQTLTKQMIEEDFGDIMTSLPGEAASPSSRLSSSVVWKSMMTPAPSSSSSSLLALAMLLQLFLQQPLWYSCSDSIQQHTVTLNDKEGGRRRSGEDRESTVRTDESVERGASLAGIQIGGVGRQCALRLLQKTNLEQNQSASTQI